MFPPHERLPLQRRCGLPISTYFSGVKLRWLLDNVDTVREEAASGACSEPPVCKRPLPSTKLNSADQPSLAPSLPPGRCLFGTIDTWLLWNLTGGAAGGKHVTDVTNASRTMLMNIATREWDDDLCK